jgi:hypothetical protein
MGHLGSTFWGDVHNKFYETDPYVQKADAVTPH